MPSSKYFNEDGTIKRFICYDLALELEECECPSDQCHCDLSNDRYYDSIYDPSVDLTVCGPCGYSDHYLEDNSINLKEYCIDSEVKEEENSNTLCLRCKDDPYNKNHSPDITFWEIDCESDTYLKILEECCICKKKVDSLYFCDDFDWIGLKNFQICLKCLQTDEEKICKKLDLILRINQYIQNLEEDIKGYKKELKSESELNKEGLKSLLEKYRNDKKLTEYLEYFDKNNNLPSIKSTKECLKGTKSDRDELESYLIDWIIKA